MAQNKQIVNNILNMVDLRTEKYRKNLAQMQKQTKTGALGIAGLWEKAGKKIAAAAGVLGVAAFVKGGYEAAKAFEAGYTQLRAFAGSLDGAKNIFYELNALEDKTTIGTDKLIQAFSNLSNKGLNASAEQIKRYSAIALGSGRDIETLTQAITGFTSGRLQSLRQFGITARKEGDDLVMSFRGQEETIKNSTRAFEDYLARISDRDFGGVLEERTATLSAAFGRLSNAWGSFLGNLFDSNSGLGSIFGGVVDGITAIITAFDNFAKSPEFKEFLDNFRQIWKDAGDLLSQFWQYSTKGFKDFFGWLVKDSGAELGDVRKLFANTFRYIQLLFVEYVKRLDALKTSVSAGAEGIGAGIGEFFDKLTNGSNPLEAASAAAAAYTGRMNDAIKEHAGELEVYDKAVKLINDDIEKANKKIDDARKAGGKGIKAPAADALIFRPSSVAPAGGGSAGADPEVTRINALREEWRGFYSELTAMKEAERLTERQAEDLKYSEQLQKIRDFHAQGLAADAEYKTALEAAETAHEERIAAIKAASFKAYRDGLNQSGGGIKTDGTILGMKEEDFEAITGGLSSLAGGLSEMTEGMNENSANYKAMFAAQKSFTVASATLSLLAAQSNALKKDWPENLVFYAQAVGFMGQILGAIRSVTMMDKGGVIRRGQSAVVGEYGPELISVAAGGAAVTSRRETAALARESMNGGGGVTVNLYEDASRAGTVERAETDEASVINIFVNSIRKRGEAARALEGTYQLRRAGA